MKKEKGQALVEMALVLPILLFLIFSVVEMAILGHSYITVQNAISSGGNMAAIGGTDTQIKTSINKAMTGLDSSKLVVAIDRNSPPDIKITLTYDVDLIIPIIPGVPNPFTVTSTLTEEIQ